METFENVEHIRAFLNYDSNNTTTEEGSTALKSASSTSTPKKDPKPKRAVSFKDPKKKNKRAAQLPSDSEEEDEEEEEIEDEEEDEEDEEDEDEDEDEESEEEVKVAVKHKNNLKIGNNNIKKPSIKIEEESTASDESTNEEDVDDIMNRPRKVFKPTKKSDKKNIPTKQKILANKSSDVSSSDEDQSDNNSSDEEEEDEEEETFADNKRLSDFSSDEGPLVVNPNHYVRGNNNHNLNFNNFIPSPRSISPNQFRPISYLQGHLSAREQELLARETGAPLINLPEKPRSPQTGLVGAIAAREVHRRSLGPGLYARQAEVEREKLLEQQRQQMLMAEREHSLYNRPGMGPPGMGPGVGVSGDKSNRFIPSNQPYYDLAPPIRNSYEYADDDDDEDDDVPLAVSSNIIPVQKQQQKQLPRNQKIR